MEKSWFSTTFSHKEHKFKQSPVGKSLCGGPGFRERSPHMTLKKKMISEIRYTEESWRKSFAPSMSPSPGAAELSAKKGLLARDPCASAQLPQLCGPLPKGPRVPRHAVRLGVGRTAARAPGGCQRDTNPTNHVVDPSGNLPTSCWGRVTCRFPQMNHRNPQCSSTSPTSRCTPWLPPCMHPQWP